MLNLNALLSTASWWRSELVPAIRYAFLGIIFLCAIILIVIVLFQNNSSDEGAFLSGGATESYYAKNKGGTMVGKLKTITVVCAILIAVLTLLYFISNLLFPIA